ncbi:MAG TPA: 3-isopropylmalate dehydratase large subunit [Candidatus Limadaptatus stercoravium]|nr:3-isopropylmalate dehydratase large subunit [Candidatus Limadaptatus stercoravium]
MKMTATQKIFARHTGRGSVTAGELITADVDLVLGNDITSPVAIKEMKKAGERVKYPDKVVLVLDHFVPAKDIKSAEQCKTVRDFAAEQGIRHFYDVGRAGVEHALLPELGLIRPGMLVIGADSHTCTYGALGCVSTGVGSTDMAAAMLTGKLWFRVPEAVKIVLTGSLKRFVTGKDVILTLIGMLGVDGATYKSLEFFGNVSALSVDDRLTIANMAVECGAKNAFFPVDEAAAEYLRSRGAEYAGSDVVLPDDDAEYGRTIELDLSSVMPAVAFPHLPSNVKFFGKDVPEGLKIDQVVIGSCTNGRLSDMRAAASVMRGRKVADGVRCIVIPATMEVYKKCIDEGLTSIFIDSGAAVSTPTCGPCLGGYMGILAHGERAVATTNRNFVGRMGDVTSEVYLASPYVAAESAIQGVLACPKE